MVQRPTSVTRVVWLVGALVAVGLVLAVLAVVLDDELVRATGVAAGTADDTRVPPTFTPVVVVLFVTLTCLLAVLLSLVVAGQDWARHALAVTLGLIGLGTVSALVTGTPPSLAVAGGVLTLALEAATILCLYRPGVAVGAVPSGS